MDFSTAFDPFRALQAAWKAIQRAPVPLLLGGVLLAITAGGGGGGPGFQGKLDGSESDWEEILPFLLPFVAVGCCLGLAFFAFSSWILVGFANVVEEALRTGAADVGKLFDSKGRFADMLLARLLAALIQLAAFLPFGVAAALSAVGADQRWFPEELGIAAAIGFGLLAMVVAIWVALGFAFVQEAVALEGLGPGAALRRSWDFASGHRLRLLLYFVVLWFVTVLGVCACCVGYFFTASLARVAAVESWLAVTRGGERAGWWIETGAPAPAAPVPGWGTPPSPPPAPPPPPPPPRPEGGRADPGARRAGAGGLQAPLARRFSIVRSVASSSPTRST